MRLKQTEGELMAKKKPVLPTVYPISKIGLSIESVAAAVAEQIKEHQDWEVTKTEITDLKGVRDKDPKRARIVGTIHLYLKCR
jgi:hypothetical protein